MELQGRVTVITGGASGIGAACARAFSLEGAKVVIADVNVEGARAVADDIGAIAIACDVGKEEDVGALIEMTEAEVGKIDVFFSNAAIATGGDPISTPVDTWQQQWQINVMGHVYAVRAVLPAMLTRGEGYLVHTASMAGILTSQGNVTYATTKHAVVGLAEWLSITYHDQGIRTSLLAPLGVNTPMLGGGNSPFARAAAGPVKEPEDVADMVVRAIHDERFLILTDEIAQTWMERKTNDLERWLHGMRRLQRKMDEVV
ncbi:MAG: SDR family oxidoreductase [Pseudomonadales bacterium]|jgi:NAD(P)-dependent dehydrogenase (short-subunit alcohol dehydrogenase family)|nr:SDR family oxidoreductase [Pseudomonadales bacterium]